MNTLKQVLVAVLALIAIPFILLGLLVGGLCNVIDYALPARHKLPRQVADKGKGLVKGSKTSMSKCWNRFKIDVIDNPEVRDVLTKSGAFLLAKLDDFGRWVEEWLTKGYSWVSARVKKTPNATTRINWSHPRITGATTLSLAAVLFAALCSIHTDQTGQAPDGGGSEGKKSTVAEMTSFEEAVQQKFDEIVNASNDKEQEKKVEELLRKDYQLKNKDSLETEDSVVVLTCRKIESYAEKNDKKLLSLILKKRQEIENIVFDTNIDEEVKEKYKEIAKAKGKKQEEKILELAKSIVRLNSLVMDGKEPSDDLKISALTYKYLEDNDVALYKKTLAKISDLTEQEKVVQAYNEIVKAKDKEQDKLIADLVQKVVKSESTADDTQDGELDFALKLYEYIGEKNFNLKLKLETEKTRFTLVKTMESKKPKNEEGGEVVIDPNEPWYLEMLGLDDHSLDVVLGELSNEIVKAEHELSQNNALSDELKLSIEKRDYLKENDKKTYSKLEKKIIENRGGDEKIKKSVFAIATAKTDAERNKKIDELIQKFVASESSAEFYEAAKTLNDLEQYAEGKDKDGGEKDHGLTAAIIDGYLRAFTLEKLPETKIASLVRQEFESDSEVKREIASSKLEKIEEYASEELRSTLREAYDQVFGNVPFTPSNQLENVSFAGTWESPHTLSDEEISLVQNKTKPCILNLSYCILKDDALIKLLDRAGAVKELILDGNEDLTDAVCAKLASYPLQKLSLKGCVHITQNGIAKLGDSKTLLRLDLPSSNSEAKYKEPEAIVKINRKGAVRWLLGQQTTLDFSASSTSYSVASSTNVYAFSAEDSKDDLFKNVQNVQDKIREATERAGRTTIIEIEEIQSPKRGGNAFGSSEKQELNNASNYNSLEKFSENDRKALGRACDEAYSSFSSEETINLILNRDGRAYNVAEEVAEKAAARLRRTSDFAHSAEWLDKYREVFKQRLSNNYEEVLTDFGITKENSTLEDNPIDRSENSSFNNKTEPSQGRSLVFLDRTYPSVLAMTENELGIDEVGDVLRILPKPNNVEKIILDGQKLRPSNLIKRETAAFFSLNGCQSLKKLSLRGADFREWDLRPIGNLENLEEIDLSDTSITDAGLVHISGCAKLQSVNLSNTKVTPKGVSELYGIATLKHIVASHFNALVSKLVSLNLQINRGTTEIDLSRQNVKNGVFGVLQPRDNIKRINLSGASCDQETLNCLAQFKGLQKLDLSKTIVGNEGLELIAQNLSGLEELNIEECRVNDYGYRNLTSLASLKKLRVSKQGLLINKEIFEDLREPLCAVISETGELDLSATTATDAQLARFASVDNLIRVNLSQCPGITGTGLVEFTSTATLESLDLSETNVSKETLPSINLHRFTALKSLNLQGNGLPFSALLPFYQINNLKFDIVSDNQDKAQEQKRVLENLNKGTLENLNLGCLSLEDLKFIAGVESARESIKSIRCEGENYAKEYLPILNKFDNMTELDLEEWEITPSDLKLLVSTPNLETIRLPKSCKTPEGLRQYVAIPKVRDSLKTLDLTDWDVVPSDLDCLAAAPNLESLSLPQSCKNSEGLKKYVEIPRLKNTLKTFDLSDWSILPNDLECLAIAPNLEALALPKNCKNSNGLKKYLELPCVASKIELINLNEWERDENIITTFTDLMPCLPNLKKIIFDKETTDNEISLLKTIESINSIDISNCHNISILSLYKILDYHNIESISLPNELERYSTFIQQGIEDRFSKVSIDCGKTEDEVTKILSAPRFSRNVREINIDGWGTKLGKYAADSISKMREIRKISFSADGAKTILLMDKLGTLSGLNKVEEIEGKDGNKNYWIYFHHLDFVKNMPNLKKISGFYIDTSYAAHNIARTKLEEVTLFAGAIADSTIADIAKMENLKVLNLIFVNWDAKTYTTPSDVTKSFFKPLQDSNNLEKINITFFRQGNYSHIDWHFLGNIPRLKSLHIEAGFRDIDWSFIRNSNTLEDISIDGNVNWINLCSSLKNNQTLQSINISFEWKFNKYYFNEPNSYSIELARQLSYQGKFQDMKSIPNFDSYNQNDLSKIMSNSEIRRKLTSVQSELETISSAQAFAYLVGSLSNLKTLRLSGLEQNFNSQDEIDMFFKCYPKLETYELKSYTGDELFIEKIKKRCILEGEYNGKKQ